MVVVLLFPVGDDQCAISQPPPSQRIGVGLALVLNRNLGGLNGQRFGNIEFSAFRSMILTFTMILSKKNRRSPTAQCNGGKPLAQTIYEKQNLVFCAPLVAIVATAICNSAQR